jgi:L-arabinose isomerase
MYTETDVSGSILSEGEKSAEKWQLGMAIPVWGIGELMKFVIKTFLHTAKNDCSCCFRKQK